ncbi:MAG: tetratricopeptide repeat protein, partial [Deltaproteobacteria bacterium]|nr:tetratricopeptide repeat protein [Deltaproteobacteria bacterium]
PQKGAELFKNGDYYGSERSLNAALKSKPDSRNVLSALASVMIFQGKHSQLETILEPMIEKNENDISLHVLLLKAKIAGGRASEALREASALLKKDETNPEVIKMIARSYMELGKLEMAEYVLKTLGETGKQADVLNMLGRIAMKKNEMQRAIEYFKEAVALDPSLPDAHNNLGVLYQATGKDNEAISEFDAAINAWPAFEAAHMNIGNSYKRLMQFDKALAAYNSALKFNPESADIYFNLGILYLEMKGGTPEEREKRCLEAISNFNKYKDLRKKGLPRDELADKYIDEANRIIDAVRKEKKSEEMKESEPKKEETPSVPDEKTEEKGDEKTEPEGF